MSWDEKDIAQRYGLLTSDMFLWPNKINLWERIGGMCVCWSRDYKVQDK